MDLPRALAPWGPFLGIFPRDLAVSLSPVLHRLSFAVGPLQVRRHNGDGEVDGYDGISRRGSYERLLASEWMLADEAPDEFVRRAAAGEHLFLRVARPVPAGSRISAAVFDAGPGQLGSPRIAQLAALIVLARRAEAAGVRFVWGILQEPEAPLQHEVNEASVLRLLQARTAHEASDAQISAWHLRLQGWREVDDLWMVGPPRLASVRGTRGASFLQVWDVLDPEARRVAIRVRRGSPSGSLSPSTLPAITLELPDPAVCARLLRDPFSVAAAAPDRLASRLVPASDLLFAPNGSKLFARAAGGGVVAFPVPNSPRSPAGAPRLYDPWPGQAATSVGLTGQQVLLASALPDGGVALSYASKKRGGGGSPGVPCPPGDVPFRGFSTGVSGAGGAPLQPIFHVALHTCLLDAEGTLFRLLDGGLLRLAGRVSAAAFVSGHLSFVEAATPGCPARLTSVVGGGAPRTVRILDEAEEGAPAFFGYGGRLTHPEHGLVAVAQKGGAWEIFSRGGGSFLVPFDGTRVLGVARDRERGEPGLLLLEEDGRSLVLAGLSWTRKLPVGAAPIRHAVACPGAPWVAWVTVHGEVTVYSLDHDAVLFRLVPTSAISAIPETSAEAIS
jgi:hypothetical protein